VETKNDDIVRLILRFAEILNSRKLNNDMILFVFKWDIHIFHKIYITFSWNLSGSYFFDVDLF
jgi:hypothetical protein